MIASGRITVCVCTYKRVEQLEKLLAAIAAQRSDDLFEIDCAVVDNDPAGSAQHLCDVAQALLPAVSALMPTPALSIRYAVEPERNIAVARNRVCDLATGNHLAFIDDDELPERDWLLRMWRVLHECNADAVLGPVRPRFETEPPRWIVRSRVCERPSHPTGTALHWRQTRTGNVLLRRDVITETGIAFDPAYGTGGEDVDFFRRAAKAGKKFVWCEEAPAYELVPPARLRRRYYLKRAFLQGRISLKYATEQHTAAAVARVAAKAFVAASAYTCLLPFLFLLGDHVGMRYLIKDCHHVSRLLAVFGFQHSANRTF